MSVQQDPTQSRDERGTTVWAPASRKEVAAWSLYDFGSSAFNTLIVTFVFGRYFAEVVAPDYDTGTVLWGRAINISALIVAVLMPVLGAAADFGGRKKLFLISFATLAIIGTAALFGVGQPGMMMLTLFIFVLANSGFEAANVFYNAFLPEVSTRDTIGRVSGTGYFVGYIGGLLSLAIGLGMIRGWLPGGAENGYLNVRATTLLVAAWFLIFCMPMFLLVRERAERRSASFATYVSVGFGRLAATIRHVRDYREAGKLILARMIYNDGLVTIIAMASIYAGAVLGMTLEAVLVMAIALNVAAGIGAFGFGFIDDRIGGKKTLVISLVVLVVAGIIGVASDTAGGFWVAAVLIGLMMGPNQSASRSLLAKLVPEQKHTEFFGLFAFSGKLSSLLGPLVYTSVVAATSDPASGQSGNHRLAMSSIIGFFIVGLLLLLFVREDEGMRRALQLEQELD